MIRLRKGVSPSIVLCVDVRWSEDEGEETAATALTQPRSQIILFGTSDEPGREQLN